MKYTVKFDLEVAQCWRDDGFNAKTIKRRIKKEFADHFIPYANSDECVVSKVEVKRQEGVTK